MYLYNVYVQPCHIYIYLIVKIEPKWTMIESLNKYAQSEYFAFELSILFKNMNMSEVNFWLLIPLIFWLN